MMEFTERYRQLSDEGLLAILADASSYQQTAIETAKQELLDRGVSEAELEELILENAKETQHKQKLLQEKRIQKHLRKKAFFDPLNPFLKGLEWHERQIRILSWIFTGIAIYVIVLLIYMLVNDYPLIHLFLESILYVEFWKGLILVLYILYIISSILGPILFWKRKRLGWALISINIVSIIVGYICTLLFYMISIPYHQFDRMVDQFMMSNVNILKYTVGTFFLTFSIYVLFKKKVKNVFHVTKATTFWTVLIAVVLQALLWMPFFLD